MTSPSRNAPDSSGPVPTSLGWVSAHAMAAGGSLAAWWLAPLTRARVDAASMSHPASGKQGDQEALLEFVKPFQTAEEHVDLIRKPIQASGRGKVAGIGALLQGGQGGQAGMAGAGLTGMGSPEESDPLSGKSFRAAAKGSAGSLADGLSAIAAAGLGGLFDKSGKSGHGPVAVKPVPSSGKRAAGGSWMEAGNPPARSANLSPGNRFPGIPNPAAAKPATATGRASMRPGSRDGLPARTNAKPELPPAQTAFEAWAEKVARKVARKLPKYASVAGDSSGPGKNLPSGSGKAGDGGTLQRLARRAPFIPPEDPETIARFKALLEAQRRPGAAGPAGSPLAWPESMGDTGSAGSEGDKSHGRPHAVTPASPPRLEAARKPGAAGPDLSDLVQDLYPPIGKSQSYPGAPGVGRDPEGDNVHPPAHAPFPTRTDRSGHGVDGDNGNGGNSPAGSTPRVPTVTVPTVAEGHPLPGRGGAETEWLQEEDDLAAKLHRLLRRQAKRRGVDLA
jgi:hypothetical protein